MAKKPQNLDARMRVKLERLADLENMLAEMVDYDVALDAAEKSPDGQDYNALWTIFQKRLVKVS